MRVEYSRSLANGRPKDVPVKIIGDPQLLPWLSLPRVVVKYSFDELGHFCLADKRNTAAAPSCTGQARSQGALLTAEIDKLVQLWARAVIQFIATLVALVHQLTKPYNPRFFIHALSLTRRHKVLHALGLAKYVHGSFIEEVLSILSLNLVDVRYVHHNLKAIVDIRISLELLRRVSTWPQLIADQLHHAFPGFAHGLLQLLHRLDSSLCERALNTGTHGQEARCKPALNYSLVVVLADGEDFGRGGQ